MRLTVKDVAEYFNVTERTVYRWIDQKIIPVYRVSDQYRFDRSEILEWATTQRIPVKAGFFEGTETAPIELTLTDAIASGGIHYRVEGHDRETVLRNIVNLIKLPNDADRDFIWQVLLAREKMASTAVGDGVAIPHVRNPVILNIGAPIVTLSFLEEPIDFDALDGKPVFCLFTMISPTARLHLRFISRLAFALKDPGVMELLHRRAARSEILSMLGQVESKIKTSPADGGKMG